MDMWCAVLAALRASPSLVLRIRLFCGGETLTLFLGYNETYGELSTLLRENWCAVSPGDMALMILSVEDIELHRP